MERKSKQEKGEKRTKKLTAEQEFKLLCTILKKEDPKKYRIFKTKYRDWLRGWKKDVARVQNYARKELAKIHTIISNIEKYRRNTADELQRFISVSNDLYDNWEEAPKRIKSRLEKSIAFLRSAKRKLTPRTTSIHRKLKKLLTLVEEWDGREPKPFEKKFKQECSHVLENIRDVETAYREQKKLFQNERREVLNLKKETGNRKARKSISVRKQKILHQVDQAITQLENLGKKTTRTKELLKVYRYLQNTLKKLADRGEQLESSTKRIYKAGTSLLKRLEILTKKHATGKTKEQLDTVISKTRTTLQEMKKDLKDNYKNYVTLVTMIMAWDGKKPKQFQKKSEKVSASIIQLSSIYTEKLAMTKTLNENIRNIIRSLKKNVVKLKSKKK